MMPVTHDGRSWSSRPVTARATGRTVAEPGWVDRSVDDPDGTADRRRVRSERRRDPRGAVPGNGSRRVRRRLREPAARSGLVLPGARGPSTPRSVVSGRWCGPCAGSSRGSRSSSCRRSAPARGSATRSSRPRTRTGSPLPSPRSARRWPGSARRGRCVTPRAAEAGAAYARLADGYALERRAPSCAEQYFRRACTKASCSARCTSGSPARLAELNRLRRGRGPPAPRASRWTPRTTTRSTSSRRVPAGRRVGRPRRWTGETTVQPDAQGHLATPGCSSASACCPTPSSTTARALAEPSTAARGRLRPRGSWWRRRGRLDEAEPLLRAAADGLGAAPRATRTTRTCCPSFGREDASATGRLPRGRWPPIRDNCGEAQLGLGELYARRGEARPGPISRGAGVPARARAAPVQLPPL